MSHPKLLLSIKVSLDQNAALMINGEEKIVKAEKLERRF